MIKVRRHYLRSLQQSLTTLPTSSAVRHPAQPPHAAHNVAVPALLQLTSDNYSYEDMTLRFQDTRGLKSHLAWQEVDTAVACSTEDTGCALCDALADSVSLADSFLADTLCWMSAHMHQSTPLKFRLPSSSPWRTSPACRRCLHPHLKTLLTLPATQ